MITTLKLLLWIAYTGFDVWINYRIIEINKNRPDYLLMNCFRGLALITYLSLIWKFQWTWWHANLILLCLTFFWIAFDLSLNLLRKKHPLYIGAESGWIDQWGFKNRAAYYIAKLVALVVLVWSITNIYNQ